MAYKNQKKNKAHIAKLKAQPTGWRASNIKSRRLKEYKKQFSKSLSTS